MSKQLFLLTGIYGAGKSTLSSSLTRKSNLCFLKASTLIHEHSLQVSPMPKTIQNQQHLDENQRVLIQALGSTPIHSPTILEGHTCLLDRSGAVRKIPISIFESINPAGIIVLSRSINNIGNSLYLRDNIHYPHNSLSQLQKHELLYSKEISEHLNIPIIYIDLDLCSIESACKKIVEFVTFSCTQA